jgi:hypothetical protein
VLAGLRPAGSLPWPLNGQQAVLSLWQRTNNRKKASGDSQL